MTIENIKSNATYKQVIADSFGGVMYNVANRDKYNSEDVALIIKTWDELAEGHRDTADGIVKGAVHFLKGD